jgi:tripartite-type tricarboxylate transporter receptor subunit TctC
MFDAIPAVLPHVKSGKLIALGIAAQKRSPFLPDVPTLAESGLKNIDAVGWMGLAAPAGTPAPILDLLNRKVQQVLDDPEIRAQMAALAFTPAGGTRRQFADFVASENAKWAEVIHGAHITLN